MKRSMCGLIVLAAVAGLGSCGGDPTGDQIEQGQQVIADPSSVFLSLAGSEFVVVQVLDQLGNQLPVDFQPQNVGPGITVERDTTYLQTTIGTHLETAQRFIITGTSPTATQFDLVSGDLSTTIPVKVTPTGTTATLSNPAPAMNEPLTVTLPAGYRFGTAPGITVGGDVGITTAVAPDSSSVTVIMPPGATGTVTLDSVQVDYLPGVNLSLPSDQTVTVGATPLAGTDAPTTAPSIPLPAAGGVAATFDVPDFTATIDHFYRLDVTEPGDYDITVDWSIGTDVDAPVCLSDPTCASEDFADPTVSGNKPETGTFTLPAGTHILWVEDYAGDAAGAELSIVITRP
jgi:hypothetical protein